MKDTYVGIDRGGGMLGSGHDSCKVVGTFWVAWEWLGAGDGVTEGREDEV